MAKKKFTTVNADEFFKSQKSFATLTVNEGNVGGELNLETGQGLTNPIANPVEESIAEQEVIKASKRRGKNRGRGALKKFKLQEEAPARGSNARAIRVENFKFPDELPAPTGIKFSKINPISGRAEIDEGMSVAESIVKGGAKRSIRAGRNRGGRTKGGSVPTPHMDDIQFEADGLTQKIGRTNRSSYDWFSLDVRNNGKGGQIIYDPLNNRTILAKNKKGITRWVNPGFVVDTDDLLARPGLRSESFPDIRAWMYDTRKGLDNQHLPVGMRGEVQSRIINVSNLQAEKQVVQSLMPVPENGVPVNLATRFDLLGSGSVRVPNPNELMQFKTRRKLINKYNSKNRPFYETKEDIAMSANMERGIQKVGRQPGSVAEYKARVQAYIHQLNVELTYLREGSATQVRRTIINDTILDLKRELRKTSLEINPTVTGLPHKIELKILETMKTPDGALPHLAGEWVTKTTKFTEPAKVLGGKPTIGTRTTRVFVQDQGVARATAIRQGVLRDPESTMVNYMSHVDRIMENNLGLNALTRRGIDPMDHLTQFYDFSPMGNVSAEVRVRGTDGNIISLDAMKQSAKRAIDHKEWMREVTQEKVKAIPLNFETNKGLAARYTTDGAQATIRSEAAQVEA